MTSQSAESQQYDTTGQIIAYEQGELDQDEVIELFQHLVDTGLAWKLQGSYGRTAKALIDGGHIQLPGHTTHDYYGNQVSGPRRDGGR